MINSDTNDEPTNKPGSATNPERTANSAYAARPSGSPATEPLLIASTEILRGRREVWIKHGDEVYRLRVTSSGKLYLSK